MQIKKLLSICVLGAGGLFALGCAPQFINEANSQTCDQVNDGISAISEEIREMQEQEERDNSAPRATMRASRMSFGAQAQANLLAYGKTIGCKFSGLDLPRSISFPQENVDDGDL